MPNIHLLSGIETITLESGATLEINYDKKLGEGSFGAVFSGKYRSANGDVVDDNVAIKIPTGANDDLDIDKETQMNLKQGICYEQSVVNGSKYIVMPNLGKPLPNELDLGRNLTDTIIPEPDVPSIDMHSLVSEIIANTPMVMHDSEAPASTMVVRDEAPAPVGTMVVRDEAPAPASTMVVRDEAPAPVGTMVVRDEAPAPVGTMVVRDDAPTSTMVVRDNAPAPISTESPTNTPAPPVASRAQSKPLASNPRAVVQGQATNTLHEIDCDPDNLTLDLDITLDIFKKMAKEVEKAHQNDILHLDLKGENFLYNKQTGAVTLIDFGVSEYISSNRPKKTIGTVAFMAPELIARNRSGNFSTEQDIYSLGRTYMLTLQNQLYALNEQSIFQGPPIPLDQIKRSVSYMFRNYPQLNNIQFKNAENSRHITAVNQLITLIRDMSELNPANRPSIEAITQRLTSINAHYSHDKTQRIQLFDAIKDLPFQGNKMVDRFLLKNAIHDFNRNQPRMQNGEKAPDVPTFDSAQLDSMITGIREHQMQRAQASTATPTIQPDITHAAITPPEAATSSPPQVDVNSLIRKTIADIMEHTQSTQHSAQRSNRAITPLMAKFGGNDVRQSALSLSQKLVDKLNELANNGTLNSDQKLDKLKESLASSLIEHQSMYKGNIQKWNNGALNRIFTNTLDTISNAQTPQLTSRNRLN